MPINQNSLGNYPKAAPHANHETYRLDPCFVPDLEQSAEVVQGSKDQSIPSLEIFGLKVSGIDKKLISHFKLALQVPLVPGHGRVVAVNKDARIKVKPDTVANIDVEFARNDQGNLGLRNFRVEFNHKLTIKNPAAALAKQSDEHSRLGIAVKDKLANVGIKSINIGEDGVVKVDGIVRALKIIKYKINDHNHGEEPMRLDEAMLAQLGLIKASRMAKTKRSLADLSKTFDVQKLLSNIGAITRAAQFDLSVVGDESKISALKNNNFLQGPKAPINIVLKGNVVLGNDGQIVIAVDGENSRLASSFGTYAPNLSAKISSISSHRPTDFTLTGSISGVAQGISFDTYSHQNVHSVLPRRRQEKGEVQKPQAEDEFNASYGSQNMQVNALVDISGQFEGGLKNVQGQAELSAKVENPYAKTQERGITIEGDVSTWLKLRRLEYVRGQGLRNTDGKVQVSINPAGSVIRKYPSITPLSFDYRVKIDKEGKAQIKPPTYGAARLVGPLQNFEGHFERIIDDSAYEQYHAIGTRENFEETRKLTGAEVKKADRVSLLIDGIKSMPARLKIIGEAQNTICMQTMVFKDDGSGWAIAKALATAAERGVAVRVIIDGLGNVEALGDLYQPNPIYQYMRENKVELFIYNDQVETGLRKMFALAQTYPEAFAEYSHPKAIASIAHMLRFLDQVVAISQDDESIVAASDRLTLKQAVHEIFMGKKGVSPQTAVNELKQSLQGNLTNLEELFLLIKRMGQATYRWHEKYLIVDENKAIIGGMNTADEYLLGGSDEDVEIKGKVQPAWRDTDILIEGDAVAEVYASFRRNWMEVANIELAPPQATTKIDPVNNDDGVTISMIQHRPFSDGDHKVTNFILYNLRSLKPGEKAWFETAYFLPRGVLRRLQKELVQAAQRGVDVRILTNSEKTSDFGALVSAAVFDSRELLKAGARLYHRTHERMVHAKVTILGDKLTMVGSWNFDNRSATHDSEDVCAIYNEKTNQEMTEQFLVDMEEQSTEVTLKDIGKRDLGQEVQSAALLLAGELA